MQQCPFCASGAEEVDNEIQHLRVQDGGSLKVLARGCRAGEHEDSGANNGPDPQCRQGPRPKAFLKLMLWIVRVRDQLVDGLPGKKLVGQWNAPLKRV